MAHRLALVLVLLLAVPVSAQDREIEAGAGLWLLNPLRVHDFKEELGVSANVAWTNWYREQEGWAVGVLWIPHHILHGTESSFFGHVTWRYRWAHDTEGDFTHLGIGAGPTLGFPGRSPDSTAFSFLWHVEAFTTHRIRDGLAVRAGVTVTPLLHVPIVVQPAVSVVWSR